MPAAHAEPAPPDEPPGEARSSHGLKVRPRSGLSVVARIENSGVFVRPITMAPALRRLRTSGASSVAIRLANAGTPFVFGSPAISTFSLIVIGTPCNGPSSSPAATCSSAMAASLIARSYNGSVIALRCVFVASARLMADCDCLARLELLVVHLSGDFGQHSSSRVRSC